MLVAEVLVGLATDATVYLSRRGGALKVKIDFHHPRFRFLMAPWAPRAPYVSLVDEGFRERGVRPPLMHHDLLGKWM